METQNVKFPVRTVIASVILLVYGLANLFDSVTSFMAQDPWWMVALDLVIGAGIVASTLAFLIKRTEPTYSTVSMVFWGAFFLQVALVFFNRGELKKEFSDDHELAFIFFVTVLIQASIYLIVKFIGFSKSADKKFKAWWYQEHPELKPVEVAKSAQADSSSDQAGPVGKA